MVVIVAPKKTFLRKPQPTTLVTSSVVPANGLSLTLYVNVNPIMKFIYTLCKCKSIIFIYIRVSVSIKMNICI